MQLLRLTFVSRARKGADNRLCLGRLLPHGLRAGTAGKAAMGQLLNAANVKALTYGAMNVVSASGELRAWLGMAGRARRRQRPNSRHGLRKHQFPGVD